MKAEIEIKQISEDIIELLGITYYSETYLKAMMEREYQKGIRKGQTIHVLEPMVDEYLKSQQ
jgi:hypothetical protein